MKTDRMTASDGQEFGIFEDANGGNYLAAVREDGSHYAPHYSAVTRPWSESGKSLALSRAVAEHEARGGDYDDDGNPL